MKIDNPSDSLAIQGILKDGKDKEFWKILKNALQDSINASSERRNSDELAELPAEQYKIENEIMKKEIELMEYLQRLPESLIKYLESPPDKEKNFDPYD